MIDLQQSDYMRTLESAIQFGLPVVLQNVQEKLDPSLDPVLNKSLMRIGGLWGWQWGDISCCLQKSFHYTVNLILFVLQEISTNTCTSGIGEYI